MKTFKAALQHFRRDLRLPEIRLLILALIVAVTAVTSVGFFTDRVDRAMRSQATALFGADLVIQSTRPINNSYDLVASRLMLSTARTIEFPSVVLSDEQSLLTQIKAVSEQYPLRGQVETSNDLISAGQATKGSPKPGQVWVEPNVLHRLGVSIGDSLQIGQTTFTIARIVTFSADSGGSLFQLAPRVLMPLGQLEETQLLTPASRASFKLLVAGDSNNVSQFQQQIENHLSESEELQSAKQGRPEISAALDRATRFMGLASIMTVVLAGAAVALATFGFTRQESRNIAILKSLGSTRRQLYVTNIQRFGLIIIITTLLGSILGYVTQFVLAQLLADWVNVELPHAGPEPLLAGFITAALTLIGFSLPTLIRLTQTPPMQIFRSEAANISTSIWLSSLSIAFALLAFLIWHAGDIKLASLVFLGILVAISVLLLLARLMTNLLRKMPTHAGSGWQMGIRSIGRYKSRSALLIASFGVAVLTLSLLSTVREDLMQSWQQSVPDSAPNHFLINIQSNELAGLEAFLKNRNIDDFQLYPMIRGRLIAINDRKVSADDYEEPRAKRLVSREFNLSATQSLPTANKVIAGDWNESQKNHELSLEVGIAKTLGLAMGDVLTFDVSGQQFSHRVGNLREVKWDSMQPNFFVIVPPDAAKEYPASHITSIRVPDEDVLFITELVREFSGITVLDVRAILTQVRKIISQASSAVEYVFGFTLLAGIVVLLAAVQTQRHERKREIAILKTMGANHKQIQQAVITEFLVIGALAGFMGSVLASFTGWALATQVFELSFQASGLHILLSIIIGALLLAVLGYRVVRTLINTQPTELLRG